MFVCCNVLLKMLTAAYFIANNISFRNMELLFAVLGFLIYVYFLHLSFFKLLFTYILIVDYLLVVRGISSFISVRVFLDSSQGWISGFGCVFLYFLSLPVLLRFFRQIVNQVYRTEVPRLWRTVWMIPGILTILTILFTNSYLEDSIESWFFFISRTSLLICVFLIYYALLQTMDNLQKQTILEQQMIFDKKIMEIQIEEQKKHAMLLKENAEQTRQMRHDLRHQLMVIQSMAGNDNPELTEYISSLIQNIPVTVKNYCTNPTVNAVVSHYADICRREGINFTAKLAVPAHNPHMADSSLCVVFGNLLENAVEACRRMPKGEKFIRLNTCLKQGILIINMDNSFDGNVSMRDDKFYSSKRDGMGIGLSSIHSVAKAHEGDVRFETDGNVFHSSFYGKL